MTRHKQRDRGPGTEDRGPALWTLDSGQDSEPHSR